MANLCRLFCWSSLLINVDYIILIPLDCHTYVDVNRCMFYIHWMQLECGCSEPAWVAATIRWPTVSPAKKQHGSLPAVPTEGQFLFSIGIGSWAQQPHLEFPMNSSDPSDEDVCNTYTYNIIQIYIYIYKKLAQCIFKALPSWRTSTTSKTQYYCHLLPLRRRISDAGQIFANVYSDPKEFTTILTWIFCGKESTVLSVLR